MNTAAHLTKKPSRIASIWGRTAKRHIVVLIAAAALVYAFSLVHGQWSPMHRWNRAFGDASVLLLGVTMSLGAAPRLFRGSARWLTWRRELGIYSVMLAVAHTVIILGGWVEWNVFRLFGFEFHPLDLRYVMLQQGFGFANAIGILALGIGLILLLTSSDRAVRSLGSASWKTVQRTALVFWALVVAHTAYFLYVHFLSFHRAIPEPNPLQLAFAIMVVTVLAIRTAAFMMTIHRRAGEVHTDK
jgi:sulfoxide reductase heme-binding subunit YedZ